MHKFEFKYDKCTKNCFLNKKIRFIILSQDTITDCVILSAKLGLESQNIYCFPEVLL